MIISKENIHEILQKMVSENKIPTFEEFQKSDISARYDKPLYIYRLDETKEEKIKRKKEEEKEKLYFLMGMEILREAIKKFSFVIPCKEVVDIIKNYGPLVEVGSGTGFWTKILQNNNTDIIATNYVDDKHFIDHKDENIYGQKIGAFAEVEDIKAEDAVKKYQNRNILVIYPCRRKNWVKSAVEHMNRNQKLLLVHQGRGGDAATDDFYDYAEKHFNVIIDNQDLPKQHNQNTFLTIFEKK